MLTIVFLKAKNSKIFAKNNIGNWNMSRAKWAKKLIIYNKKITKTYFIFMTRETLKNLKFKREISGSVFY